VLLRGVSAALRTRGRGRLQADVWGTEACLCKRNCFKSQNGVFKSARVKSRATTGEMKGDLGRWKRGGRKKNRKQNENPQAEC